MSRSVISYPPGILTPSAYSKHVSLWWENVGVATSFAFVKLLLFVYTVVLVSPSKKENCQK